MTRRVGLVAAAAVAVMSVAGCSDRAEVKTKVTVEVQTPRGVRAGSSVWSWSLSKPTVALGSPYGGGFRGEAVAVDLPGGRTLFALIQGQEMLAERHLQPREMIASGDRVAAVRAIGAATGRRAQLTCKPPETAVDEARFDPEYDCPLLVTFADLRDPKSVARVDPAALDKSFGPGVALKRITVEVTDAPVTTGIEKRWAWWNFVKAQGGNFIPMVRGKSGGYEAAQGYDTSLVDLGLSNFSTEAYK